MRRVRMPAFARLAQATMNLSDQVLSWLADPGIRKAALEHRQLEDERRAPPGMWRDGKFLLRHRCTACEGMNEYGTAMVIHGKDPGHLAQVHGAPGKAAQVYELSRAMRMNPALKEPDTVRALLAQRAARLAIEQSSPGDGGKIEP